MKPPRLVSYLRTLSYTLCGVFVFFSILYVCTAWIGKPLVVRSPETHHNGISFWQFDLVLMPSLDGVPYHGTRNSSIFFSRGELNLCIGQEGTPPALIILSNWKTAAVGLLGLLVSTILWLFGRLFGAIKRGESFSLQSVRRIRMMGWCFLGCFALSSVFEWVIYLLLTKDFPFQPLGTGGLFIKPQIPSLNLTTALFGLFAFALAEVLRQGLMLKQENDLTV